MSAKKKPSATNHKLDLLATIEGYFLGSVLKYLYQTEILWHLDQWQSVDDLVRLTGADPVFLGGVLDFVLIKTELIDRNSSDEYRLRFGAKTTEARFLLHKYMGAYGAIGTHLEDVSKNRSFGKTLVSGLGLAAAFESIVPRDFLLTRTLFADAGVKRLLDIGCGNGELLLDFVASDSNCFGVGIDQNIAMLDFGRERAKLLGCHSRIKLVEGDATSRARLTQIAKKFGIDAVYASSLFNEFFDDGRDTALQYLLMLKSIFPGKKMFICDYYGVLGSCQKLTRSNRQAPLHDFVQLMSGQAVPPSTRSRWVELYCDAGCRTRSILEGNSGGFHWFIHVIDL
jgi:SAM-dependent methyltransferase